MINFFLWILLSHLSHQSFSNQPISASNVDFQAPYVQVPSMSLEVPVTTQVPSSSSERRYVVLI